MLSELLAFTQSQNKTYKVLYKILNIFYYFHLFFPLLNINITLFRIWWDLNPRYNINYTILFKRITLNRSATYIFNTSWTGLEPTSDWLTANYFTIKTTKQ